MRLTKEQIRYAVRVLSYSGRSDYADEDIKPDIKKISNIYGENRSGYL